MIDPTQLPILLKAIDFVFEEGRKILEERRERRRMQDNAQKDEIQTQEQAKDAAPVEVREKDEVKQRLLSSKIDEILWQNHEMEVQHLVRLLETYSRNYHLAREQYAKWGSALVPPIIIHNMTEAENSVLEATRQLKAILLKVYQKDINSNQ